MKIVNFEADDAEYFPALGLSLHPGPNELTDEAADAAKGILAERTRVAKAEAKDEAKAEKEEKAAVKAAKVKG